MRTSAAVARVERGSLRPNIAAAPDGVVSLAVGEPDFATPEVILDAATEALRSGATHYVDQHGDPELRAALAARLSCLAGAPRTEDQVLVTHGATAALSAAILGTVDPGDRVVIPEPCYSLYPDLVRLAGGKPVLVPLAADLHWDLGALRTALSGARMIIYSNPANPTGVVHGIDELRALGDLLAGSETLVLADEAYAAIVYKPERFCSTLSVEALRERTIYVQTLSKTYAMTGWRIGYLVGPPEIVAAAGRIHRTFNGAVNAAVQRAGLVAVSHGESLADHMVAEYRKRRDVLFERLADIPELTAPLPEGTFYAFAKYTPELSSTQFCARLRAAGVLVRPGIEYGPSGEGHIRFSFATDIDRIQLAMDRIVGCLDSWR